MGFDTVCKQEAFFAENFNYVVRIMYITINMCICHYNTHYVLTPMPDMKPQLAEKSLSVYQFSYVLLSACIPAIHTNAVSACIHGHAL